MQTYYLDIELIPDPPRQLHFVPSSFNRTRICSAEKEPDKRYPDKIRYCAEKSGIQQQNQVVSKIMDILMVFSNKTKSDLVFSSKATSTQVFSRKTTSNLLFSSKTASNLLFSSKATSNLVFSSKTSSNLVFSSKATSNLVFSSKATSNLVFSSKATSNLVFSSKATSNPVFRSKTATNRAFSSRPRYHRYPIPSPGAFWMYLLSFCPAQVSTCYGCGACVKPGGRIPGQPHDLVFVSNMMREYRKDGHVLRK